MAANSYTQHHFDSTTEPKSIGDVAQVKGALRHDWLGVVRAEERSVLFKELISERLGTDDVENFVAKQNGLKHSKHSKGGGRDGFKGN